MFRQVIAYRWADGLTDEAKAAFRASLESLRSIPELHALTYGDEAGHFPGNHDFVMVMDFPDFAAARRYVEDPCHQTFIHDHAMKAFKERVVVQHDWGVGDIAGIHHVKLPVSDVARSRDWYAEALGLQVSQEFRDDGELSGVGMVHPSTGTGLALRRDPERAAAMRGFDAVALTVGTRTDLDLMLERLRDKGLGFGEVLPGRVGVVVDLPDPDGIVVRLFTLTQD